MDTRRSRTNIVLEPFFYSKMFIPGYPHSREEFALEMRVDVEGLRMGIILSKPEPPPHYDASPRWLPAVDTGSDEPGVSRAQSTERKKIIPRANVDGVDDNNKATAGTSQQALLARGSQDQRRSGSSKKKFQLGLPSKASSLTGGGQQ